MKKTGTADTRDIDFSSFIFKKTDVLRGRKTLAKNFYN